MNRTLKQILYGGAYLFIILLVIWLVYSVWLKKPVPPPCDALCAAQGMQVDTSTTPITFQTGQDQSSVLVTLNNDSSQYGVTFHYNVTVNDVIGEQVDNFSGESSIYPEGSRYLVFSGIPSSANEESVDVMTSDVKWLPVSEMPQYNLSIDPKSILTNLTQSGGYVGGAITNNSGSSILDVTVQALVYDLSGNIIGASASDLGQLAASSTEQFQVSFPSMDSKTINSIDKTRTAIFYEVTEN